MSSEFKFTVFIAVCGGLLALLLNYLFGGWVYVLAVCTMPFTFGALARRLYINYQFNKKFQDKW